MQKVVLSSMKEKSKTAGSIERTVTLAALICIAVYDYGIRILILCAAAVFASVLTELVCLYVRRIPFRLRHLDAAVCGLILVMMMPQTVSVSLVIMSAIFAIIIGRQMFGGREHSVIPAAAVGYCFALLNQRAQMTLFPAEKAILPFENIPVDSLVPGVSVIWNQSGDFSSNVSDYLLGLPSQPIGTSSLLLLAVIAVVLIFRRSASAWVMLPMLIVLLTGNLALSNFHNPAIIFAGSCLTNQTLFSVIYLYSDPDFAPPHIAGALYGVLSALLILVFTRVFAVFDAPVLLAVILSPLPLGLRSIHLESNKQSRKGDIAHAE